MRNMYGIKKKRKFLPITAIIASIVMVVGIIISVACLKVDTKINLDILSDGTHQTETRTLNGTTLTSEFLQDVVQEGRVFSGWYYDDNYTIKAKVGDKVSANTTLFARQQSEVEGAFWSRVDNQLNAGGLVTKTSPFSNDEGDGTEESPYIITTAEDMGVFSRIMSELEWEDFYLTSYYKLANDIRLDEVDVTWPSVGTKTRQFSGTFDGDGHMVYYISGTKGMFNYIKDATIKNLTVKGLNVSASEVVGGLASTVAGTSVIKNCQVWGDINSNSEIVGGLVGTVSDASSKTIIEISQTNVRINATSSSNQTAVAGLVGIAYNVEIKGCMTFGVVESNGSNVGGLVGQATKLTMEHSINNSSVKGATNVGGLVGNVTDSASTIHNSFNRGNIKSEGAKIGGLVGELNGTVVNAYNVATIQTNGNANVAGVVGYGSSSAVVNNCYSLGNVVCTISVISYNPIINGEATVSNCGYNNNFTINGVVVDSINNQSTTYSNATNLFDGTNANKQDVLANSLNKSATYNSYTTSGISWNETYLWKTNVMDFTKVGPEILSNADFSQTTYQVTFYVNGLKKLVVPYTSTQKVQEPEIGGMSVTWYKDANFSERYLFNSTISSNISIYGKGEVDEGIEYTIALDPEVTGAKLTATSLKVKKGKDFTATLVSTTTKKISRVEVAMENNENPTVSYNTETGELIISNVVGNVYITPIFLESLDTPIIGIVENELVIQPVNNATDYTVDLYKDGVKQSSYTPIGSYKNKVSLTPNTTQISPFECVGWDIDVSSGSANLISKNITETDNGKHYIKFEIPFAGTLNFTYNIDALDGDPTNDDEYSIKMFIIDDEFGMSGEPYTNFFSEITGDGDDVWTLAENLYLSDAVSGEVSADVDTTYFFYLSIENNYNVDMAGRIIISDLQIDGEPLIDENGDFYSGSVYEYDAETDSYNFPTVSDERSEWGMANRMFVRAPYSGIMSFDLSSNYEEGFFEAYLLRVGDFGYNPYAICQEISFDGDLGYYSSGNTLYSYGGITTFLQRVQFYVEEGDYVYFLSIASGEDGYAHTISSFYLYSYDFEQKDINSLKIEAVDLNWTVVDENTWQSTNVGIKNSYSYLAFNVPKTGLLSFDYEYTNDPEHKAINGSGLGASRELVYVCDSSWHLLYTHYLGIDQQERKMYVEESQIVVISIYHNENYLSYAKVSNIKIYDVNGSSVSTSDITLDTTVTRPFTKTNSTTFTSSNYGTKESSTLQFEITKTGVISFDWSVTKQTPTIDISLSVAYSGKWLYSSNSSVLKGSCAVFVNSGDVFTVYVPGYSKDIDAYARISNIKMAELTDILATEPLNITKSNINQKSIEGYFTKQSRQDEVCFYPNLSKDANNFSTLKYKVETTGMLMFDIKVEKDSDFGLTLSVLDASGKFVKDIVPDASMLWIHPVGLNRTFAIDVAQGQYLYIGFNDLEGSGNYGCYVNNFRYADNTQNKRLDLTGIKANMEADSDYKLVVTAKDSTNKYASSQAEIALS